MSKPIKRKPVTKNDARLYQAERYLSTIEVTRAGLSDWIKNILVSDPPHVWLLSGQLGAGKTTLVQSLGRVLGVRGDITSPTFSLQKIHPLVNQPWKRLVHLDAYRLKGLHEIAALELEDHISNAEHLVVVEWPERLAGVVWGPHLAVMLSSGGRSTRRRITWRKY